MAKKTEKEMTEARNKAMKAKCDSGVDARGYPAHLLESNLEKVYHAGEITRGDYYAITEFDRAKTRQGIYDEVMAKKKKAKK
jgi:hypothetical protein